MRAALFFCALFSCLVLAVGCKSGNHWYFSGHEHEHAADWSYEGETGPAHWGDLSPKYAAAKSGRAQSPIDIVTASVAASDLAAPEIHYASTNASFLNNGHTLEHKEGTENWLEWNGTRFTLAQFHFHTPSEHTIDGKHAPMEMHLVHKDKSGTVLVLSVMVQEGGSNAGVAAAANSLPALEQAGSDVTVALDASSFLPASRGCFQYMGSFTTPPCTEGVIWLVLREPVKASSDAIAKFKKIMGKNNRPTQPLNGRAVERAG